MKRAILLIIAYAQLKLMIVQNSNIGVRAMIHSCILNISIFGVYEQRMYKDATTKN